MYIATKYIGKKYTPGEILPDNLPAEQVKWLLEAGAIRKAAPTPGQTIEPENDEEDAEKPETPNAKSDAEDTEEPETQEAETNAEDAEEPEDEIDEEAEAPEIDVMDGLVPAKEENPTQTAARKPAAKKGGKAK